MNENAITQYIHSVFTYPKEHNEKSTYPEYFYNSHKKMANRNE